MTTPRRHVLTVNLEDYFQVGAFNRFIQRTRWQRFESHVAVCTDRTLDLLATHSATATFFVLGWIAEKYPQLVRKVADAGHEVAVRGFYHRSIRDMTEEEFRADTLRARDAVEAASGQKAVGYRVADGWFGPDDLWALDVLAELGFAYDSSIAPMRAAFGDDPRRFTPHRHQAGDRTILELPVSTGRVLGVRVPVAGGNYLRQLPRVLTRAACATWDRERTAPLVAYFHTWELGHDQPEMTGVSWLTRLRHYRNLDKMPARLGELLGTHRFGSAAEYLGLPAEPAPQRMRLPDRPAPLPLAVVPAEDRTPVSVVVPCFNEELLVPHLRNTLDEVAASLGDRYAVTFLLVDDGSTDNTWQQLVKAFDRRDGFRLVRHDVNQGIAAALTTGLREANTEIVCSMDSDCTYDPLKLGEMIPLLAPGVDLVTASPYHPAGGVRNVPGWRLVLSKGCAWMYRRLLGAKLHTYTSCFRVYRRSTVAAVQVFNPRFLGVAELVGRLDLAGGTVVEFPAVLESRMIGRSKMKTVRTVLGHLRLMLRLTADRWRRRHTTDRDAVLRGQLAHVRSVMAADPPSDPPSDPPPGVSSVTPISVGRLERPTDAPVPSTATSQ